MNLLSNLVEVAGDFNPRASVRVFARLNDPDIGIFLLCKLVVGPSELVILAI